MKKAILLVLLLLLPFLAFPMQCEADTEDIWAVIVGGEDVDDAFEFQIDSYYLYYVLTRKYNVDNSHIMWLHSDGDAYEFESGSIDGVSTLISVRWAISGWLPTHADANDKVIIYFKCHGGGYNTEKDEFVLVGSDGFYSDEGSEHEDASSNWFGVDEALWVYDEVNKQLYYDDDLEADLSGWVCGDLLVLLGSCFGGGFIDDLSGSMRTIISSTGETIKAYMDGDGDGFSEFEEGFFDALFGYDTEFDPAAYEKGGIVVDYSKPIDADSNNDGEVSWREAFDYAYENDDARIAGKETPWFDDDGNRYPTYVNGETVMDYRLTVLHNHGGTTNPSGEHVYVEGTVVKVYADPLNTNYVFDYWVPDDWVYHPPYDTPYPRYNPYPVTMDSDHFLMAYFRYVGSGGSGGGGCPILSVYDGTDYFEEGLLDIHNSDGVDVTYEHTLVSTPQRENGAYLLRLTEHPQTESHIDQVKLYAMLEDGTMIKLPLIYAWHSEDGNVLAQLLHSDDWKADTLGADLNNGTSQSIDLKFASLSSNLEIIGFVFEIEGNNMLLK